MQKEVKFDTPSLKQRILGMLGVDFYRLFHTPLFYIFLLISAIIPAMVSGMTAMPAPDGGSMNMYSNVWQIIASQKTLYVIESIADYANMNMVFIFGGIMVSIFIGHDYKSGYVKQLFTSHPKKCDYMISKTLVCAFSMACMCITYFIGGTVAGLIVGYNRDVNALSLIIAILGKIVMSLGWASLYTFLNVLFRRYFGISILSSFFFGTGILIIGAASVVESLSLPTFFLNVFLYGASVSASLSCGPLTLISCALCSFGWAIIYNYLGTLILLRCDVY